MGTKLKMSRIIGIAALARSGKDTVASILLKHKDVTTYALADPLKIGCQVLFGLTDAETWDDSLKEKIIPHWGWSPRKFFQTVGTDWLRELNPEHWLLRANLALNQNETHDSAKAYYDLSDPKAPFRLAAQAIFGITQAEAWSPSLLECENQYWNMTPNQMINYLQDHAFSEFSNYNELRSKRLISLPSRVIPTHGKNDIVIIKDVRFENEADFIRCHNGIIWHIKRDKALKVISHSSEKGIKIKKGDIVINNNCSLEDLELAVKKEWEKFSYG